RQQQLDRVGLVAARPDQLAGAVELAGGGLALLHRDRQRVGRRVGRRLELGDRRPPLRRLAVLLDLLGAARRRGGVGRRGGRVGVVRRGGRAGAQRAGRVHTGQLQLRRGGGVARHGAQGVDQLGGRLEAVVG